jgi:hypothetical protein
MEKPPFRILVDADGCPVVKIAVDTAFRLGAECILLCDTSHEFDYDGVNTVTVGKGADSVDFALVNMARPGDIVVTQDYGLAAMCLARSAKPIDQNGMVYTDNNIDGLLNARHIAKKIRRAGGRLKGPPKRTAAQDEAFRASLVALIKSGTRG